MRRITAPKPPMDFITPYSWRTGMETVKKVLGSSRPKSSASTRPQSAASQDTTSVTTPVTSDLEMHDNKEDEKWKETREEKEEREMSDEVMEEDKKNDTDLSEGLLSEGVLSQEAKSILSDLDSDKSGNNNFILPQV